MKATKEATKGFIRLNASCQKVLVAFQRFMGAINRAFPPLSGTCRRAWLDGRPHKIRARWGTVYQVMDFTLDGPAYRCVSEDAPGVVYLIPWDQVRDGPDEGEPWWFIGQAERLTILARRAT